MQRLNRFVVLAAVLLLACACSDDAGEPDPDPTPTGPDPQVDETLDEDSLWWAKSERLYAAAPAAGPDGQVYFGGWDGTLYAHDADGEELWRVDTGAKIDSAPAVADDGTIYVGSWDGALYAVSADGDVEWTLQAGSPIDVSPSIDSQGRVYVASDDGTLYAVEADGSELWQIALSAAPTTAASIFDDGTDQTIYIGTADEGLHCIEDGQISATANITGHAIDDVALDADAHAWVGTTAGRVVKVDRSCDIVWEENLTWARLSSPTLDEDGHAYIGGANRQMYKVDAGDGSRLWATANANRAAVIEPPTAVADDRLLGSGTALIEVSPAGDIEILSSLDIISAPLITADGGVYAVTERGHMARLDMQAPALADSDWPIQFGNPQRTGYLAP